MHKILKLRLEITNGCPLVCNHCSVAAGPHLRSEMHLESALKLIGDFKAQGGIEVSVTGGEPLLHNDCLKIVTISHRLGLLTSVFSMGLDRQGAPITESRAYQFSGNVDEWWVSIHGSTSTIHDAITRFPSSLEKTLAASKVLDRAGIPVKATFVIRPDNLDELPRVASICNEIGMAELRVLIIIPQGRARKLAKDSAVDIDQLNSSISHARQTAPEIPIRIGQAAKAGLRLQNDCGAIKNELVVNWDGWISPCHAWEPQFSLDGDDNVFLTSLEQVLRRSPRLQVCADAVETFNSPGCSDGCLARKVLNQVAGINRTVALTESSLQ